MIRFLVNRPPKKCCILLQVVAYLDATRVAGLSAPGFCLLGGTTCSLSVRSHA